MSEKKKGKGTRRRNGSGQVRVTKETRTGGNECFRDDDTGLEMTRAEFVKEIEAGAYPGYHVREIAGVKVPAANPDGKRSNNLG